MLAKIVEWSEKGPREWRTRVPGGWVESQIAVGPSRPTVGVPLGELRGSGRTMRDRDEVCPFNEKFTKVLMLAPDVGLV
jgi:hypothetical protein